MKTNFEKGDKIIYRYAHWLNSKSFTMIEKTGVYIDKVKTGPFSQSWHDPKVRVQLDGNKKESRVLTSQIRHA